jgi:Zn-dependent protease
VHAERLKALAAQAQAATAEHRLADALSAWRTAATLLPPGTRQGEDIDARIQALSAQVASGAKPVGAGAKAVGVGATLLLLLSKGKFLLLGLTKIPTLLTMFAAFGAYWALWGWRFAAGFVVSLYIHEMGHVAALRRYGIAASAPMFIPGLGAMVRMDHRPANPSEDAAVGLAGPIWGTGAALACGAVSLATGSAFWLGLAHVGAWINLFNLLPLFSLDGGRAFAALTGQQRALAAMALAAAYFGTGEAMVALVCLAAVFRAFQKSAPTQGDGKALGTYVGLIGVLCALVVLTRG